MCLELKKAVKQDLKGGLVKQLLIVTLMLSASVTPSQTEPHSNNYDSVNSLST
jgi:hypothetical protein